MSAEEDVRCGRLNQSGKLNEGLWPLWSAKDVAMSMLAWFERFELYSMELNSHWNSTHPMNDPWER